MGAHQKFCHPISYRNTAILKHSEQIISRIHQRAEQKVIKIFIGFFGSFFASYGIQIAYTKIGLTIAMVFVGIPFVVRSIQPVLEKLDPTYEEAGSMLGASQFTIFRRIIFPELRPALLTGFGLAFARGLGEYGSVIYISGNSAKHHTQVVSYVIMQKLNYVDYASATAIALAMLVIAFVTLFSINMIQVHQARRVQ